MLADPHLHRRGLAVGPGVVGDQGQWPPPRITSLDHATAAQPTEAPSEWGSRSLGSAALLSRAVAGMRAGRVVFAIPGSRGAVRLAMEKLILPELGHLVAQAGKTR